MATSPQDVIKTFMASLDKTTLSGTAALDEAIKACSNFKGIQDAIDHMLEDRKNSSSGYYFLRRYCDINPYNDDTGAITGSDAGGSKVKNAEDIVPESGSARYPSSTTFTKRGLTVVVPEKSTLTKAEQIVVQGLYSWWIEEALKLIEESYGSNYTFSDHTIYLEFYNDSSDRSAARAGLSYLGINMAYWSQSGLENDAINGGYSSFYLDRVIAHELTHSIMSTNMNIYSFASLPEFIVEGMAELTPGVDDNRNDNIKDIVKDPSQLAIYTDINHMGTGETNYYAGGFIFLRYLAKQASDFADIDIDEDYSKIYIETEKDVFLNETNCSIIGNDMSNSIYNEGNSLIIDR